MALQSLMGTGAISLCCMMALCLHQLSSCYAFSAPYTSCIAIKHMSNKPQGALLPHRFTTTHQLQLSMMSSSATSTSYNNNNGSIPRDVLIIGGGLAGLSVAHYISTNSNRHVTILERELPSQQRTKTTAGSFAAAGMLAPQSERLPAGPLLDICLQSRNMYGDYVKCVERGARESSLGCAVAGKKKNNYRGGGGDMMYTGEGAKYLWELTDDDGILSSFDDGPSPPLEPWETGFHSTGGFLAPAFAGDVVATWSPQPNSGKAYWLDNIQVRELEPQLHPNVVGGWWFPEDASVDARRLTCSLRAACVGAGVQMQFGSEYDVKSLEMNSGTCEGVHLANGKVYKPNSIVVANGSWMRHLLPLPVTPHKGQSFSLRMPTNAPPILSRVLFAQDTYIVPKADGRIIVGATVEPGKFDGDITPSGMMHCLSEATRLIPSLGELPIEESWAGLRPTTPDKCPILGITEQWDNVYIAGGYWRNGVLLAPKTGQLIGDLIINNGNMNELSEGDQALLKAFSWDRFTTPGGGKKLAADSRYASQFYPVHKRSTDGVAVSVGTELGFYEGAAAAKGDRAKDRKSMFGISDEEELALERAAAIGVDDAQAYSFGDDGDGWMVRKRGGGGADESATATTTAPVAAKIGDDVSLGETMAVEADHTDALTVGIKQDPTIDESSSKGGEDKDKPLDDGYTAIQEAYGDESFNNARAAMRKARMSNRVKVSEIDESKIGVMGMSAAEPSPQPSKTIESGTTSSDISSIYEKIKANKAIANKDIEMGENTEEERTGFDFTIYHVDSDTGEERKVPPYTSPGEFLNMIEQEKSASRNDISKSVNGSKAVNGSKSPEPPIVSQPVANVDESDSGIIDDGSDEKTYDGYQAIQAANSAESREEELLRMREARLKNRQRASEIMGGSDDSLPLL